MALTATDTVVDIGQVEYPSTSASAAAENVDRLPTSGLTIPELLVFGSFLNQLVLLLLGGLTYFAGLEPSLRPLREFLQLVLCASAAVGSGMLFFPTLFSSSGYVVGEGQIEGAFVDRKLAWIAAISVVTLAISFVLGLLENAMPLGQGFYQGIAISLVGIVLAINRRVGTEFSKMALSYSLIRAGDLVREITSDGKSRMVAPRSVERYAELLVQRGERVALDGEVVHGAADVLERRFSGALFRKFLQVGDVVLAGTIIQDGSLRIKVMHTADELTGSLAEPIIIRAHEDISKVERRYDGWVYVVAAAIAFYAACAFNFWLERGGSVASNLQIFGLVVAGGLVLRVGFLVFNAQAAAVSKLFLGGILLRRADVMRSLARIKNLVVDYRSSASPSLVKVELVEMVDSRFDQAELVKLAVALLSRSLDVVNQSIALAMVEQVKECSLLKEVDNFVDGGVRGVLGVVRGVDITVGQEALLVERGISLEVSEVLPPASNEKAIYIAIGTNLVARVRVSLSFANYLARMVVGGGRGAADITVLSGERPDSLIGLADQAGLEDSEVIGGLSRASYEAALVERTPCALLLNRETPDHYMPVVECSIVHFDEVRCELEEADVVMFSEQPSLVSFPLRTSRQFSFISRAFLAGMVASGVFGLFAAASPQIGLLGLAITAILPLLYLSGFKLIFRENSNS